MNESSPKQNRQWLRRACWIWLAFFIAIAAVPAWLDLESLRRGDHQAPYWQQLLMIAVWATLALGLWCLIRWPFTSWPNFRRTLVGFAILATLVAIFYTEENWRGKRAWENYKRELEAKGAVLDWNKYIPPPVPDDQNFFTVNTNFYLKFVKLQTAEQSEAAKRVQWLNLSNGFPILDLAKVQPVVAEIMIIAPRDAEATTINFQSSEATDRLQAALRKVVGRDANGSVGFKFTEFPISNLVPAKIDVLADSPPTVAELAKLISPTLFTNIGKLAVTATADPKRFQIRFTDGRVTAAADYLAWGDQYYAADLDDVRAGLKRPYALIPGDYAVPYLIPIPNFVVMRSIAQTSAQRCQCYLLMNRPDLAVRELELLHDLCRILERSPTGKPETLVEAMINVAIHGLYATTVQEGFRLHGWLEPQLIAIQKQMAETKLLPPVNEAFHEEQVHVVYLGENRNFRKLMSGELFGYYQKRPWWEKAFLHIKYGLMPQGWVYLNTKNAAMLSQLSIDALSDSTETVAPKRVEAANQNVSRFIENDHSPFYLLASIAIPNFNKALQTCSFNQTLANEAQIACALERYKLANGNYPDSLAALAPQFMEKIPHDIIGGQPLHYRRTADGKFLLYSVGWNETDDGGITAKDKSGNDDRTNGDWVWEYPY